MSAYKSFGDFQEQVGKRSGNAGRIIWPIVGVIFIIGSIVALVFALIPTSTFDSSNLDCTSDSDCTTSDEKCIDKKCRGKKKRPLWLLWVTLILLLLGIGFIWFGFWFHSYVHKGRAQAQKGALFTELNAINSSR